VRLPGERRVKRIKQPVLSGELALSLRSRHLSFKPEGTFPRRVQIGEILALDGDFPLLSPVSGLLLHEANQELSLRIEGRIDFAAAPVDFQTQKREFFLEQLRSHGIYNFAVDEPLHRVLRQLTTEEPLILLCLSDIKNQLRWKSILPESALEKTKELLLHFFPRARIRIWQEKRYPFKNELQMMRDHLPERHAFLQLGSYQKEKSLAAQGLVVVDPATLLAVYECFFLGRPFVSSYFVRRSGLVAEAYRVVNGYPLSGIQGGQQNSFNIFDAFAPEPYKAVSASGLCQGCRSCNTICPVDARPLSLLEDRVSFQVESCSMCQLCSRACPAQIDLMGLHPGRQS